MVTDRVVCERIDQPLTFPNYAEQQLVTELLSSGSLLTNALHKKVTQELLDEDARLSLVEQTVFGPNAK